MSSRSQSGRFGHAVVIGGSMGGLLAARVLSEHFVRVTLIERDAFPSEPAQRKGVPQGRHAHALLATGLTILSRWFPDLEQGMVADGAIPGDIGARLRWFHLGGYKRQFQSGFHGIFSSRPLLESHVRRRVLALGNVVALPETDVEGLVLSPDRSRVTGVRIRPRADGSVGRELAADLVLDGTGRGSRTPQWLEAFGFDRAPETAVKIDVGYATRIYRRRQSDVRGADAIVISPTPPHEKQAGVFLPMEGDRWILTIGGWCGEHAPSDEAGFMASVRSLPAPDIYDVVSRAEPLSEIMTHRFPSNLRRHYERLARFPEGFLVMGDALCSFNPIYGQGMTTSALESTALDRTLSEAREAGRLDGSWRTFFRRAAKVIDIPWAIAGEDFQYPEVEGARPPAIDLINRYVGQVHRASATDAEVYRAFLYVMNLQKAPPTVFAPATAMRVARAAWRRRREATTGASQVAGALAEG